MTITEWLENVRKLDYAVENMIQRKEEIRTLATKVSVGAGDDMPHGSGTSDSVGNLVAKLVDLEKKIDQSIDHYVDYKTEVCVTLIKLPTKQYQALYLHYIEYRAWTEVADQMGYSPVQIHRIKNEGLANLQNMVGHVIECYTISVI